MRFELGDNLHFWTVEPVRDHYLIGKVIDFNNGLCYVFAEWLYKRLYHSEIVYLKNEHHYVVKYNDRLYDITGDVTEQFQDEETDIHQFFGDWYRNR